MKIRAQFSKLKDVRYISHLELMDTLRRALRRARFPVSYTQGYNPHIKLSLGQPLAVGMIGLEEYFDLELEERVEPRYFVYLLNDKLPDSIKINEARYVPDDVKSLQAIVNTAVYIINLDFSNSINEEKIVYEFKNLSEIKILRHRRNKKDRVFDLKPMLYDVEVVRDGQWRFTVSTGSSGNVRPSELIRALAERYEQINQVPLVNITREGMFVRRDNTLYKPFASRIVRS